MYPVAPGPSSPQDPEDPDDPEDPEDPDAAAEHVYDDLRTLIEVDLPVLIEEETGVGKEQIARILRASARRRSGPFVAINCAAIPADLLEAEMLDGRDRGRGKTPPLRQDRCGL